jgi:predicted  nucleic acid-binding Zn-ribbon protein
MARVVQRRSAPPYLLIVFVFLFVISTIMAVLGFTQSRKGKADNVQLESRLDDLQKQKDKLASQINELVQKVTGQPGTPDGAILAAETAYTNPVYKAVGGERAGLATEMLHLAQKIAKLQDTVKGLQVEVETKSSEVEAKGKAVEKLQKDHEAQLTKLNDEKAKAVAALATEKKARQDALKDAQVEHEKNIEQLRNDLTDKEKKVGELVLQIEKKDQEIKRLEEELEIRQPPDQPLILKALGRVEKVPQNAAVCYINLGGKDRLRPGMTFSVYDQKGLKEGNIKGRLLVTNVSSNFSECKILEQNQDSPIAVGDGIANPAFDPVRQYEFVVEGLFDLQGTGNPTKFGTQEVIDAVRRFGAKVGDQVTYQTDYVVLGDPPQEPVKPAPDDPTSAQQAYQRQYKLYKQYENIKALALSMKIPILDTERFLRLTGYEPEKAPE